MSSQRKFKLKTCSGRSDSCARILPITTVSLIKLVTNSTWNLLPSHNYRCDNMTLGYVASITQQFVYVILPLHSLNTYAPFNSSRTMCIMYIVGRCFCSRITNRFIVMSKRKQQVCVAGCNSVVATLLLSIL